MSRKLTSKVATDVPNYYSSACSSLHFIRWSLPNSALFTCH